jgi:cytidine deaminase
MNPSELLDKAWAVRNAAYAPYSRFAVGAALMAESGQVFTGCNVENISFGLTICAERAAVCAAIASGVRRFRMIGIVSDSLTPVSPCGACRQVLAEFSDDLRVVCENQNGVRFEASLSELLPRAKAGIMDQQQQCST